MLNNKFTQLALPFFLVTLLACCSCGQSTPVPSSTAAVPSGVHELPYVPGDLPDWKTSEAEAIATASQYVPAEVVSHAKILAGQGGSGNTRTGEQHFYWEVLYMNISVTEDWLGWQSDNQTILDSTEPYNVISVRIDAITGEFMDRRAYATVSLGGPIGSTPSPVISWTPSSTKAAQ